MCFFVVCALLDKRVEWTTFGNRFGGKYNIPRPPPLSRVLDEKSKKIFAVLNYSDLSLRVWNVCRKFVPLKQE